MSQYVVGGSARAVLFQGETLYATGNTLNNSEINYSIDSTDLRGGQKNALVAQYFHDPNVAITLTNVLFSFDEAALALGGTMSMGGLSLKEERVAIGTGNKATPTETPISADGGNEIMVWYKKPTDTLWSNAVYTGDSITIPSSTQNEPYCLKYFWNNPNARSMRVKATYEPAEVHLVLIKDIYFAEVQKSGQTVPGAKAGNLFFDIPRYKLNGNLDLAFAAGDTAGTSLSGNALAVNDGTSCEEDMIYGTITEEIFNAKWEDSVIALAVENSELEMSQSASETLIVRAVFGDGMASQRKDNKNFTFTIASAPVATATGVKVTNEGVVSAGTVTGDAVIEVTLTGAPSVPPAFVSVSVT